MSTLRSLPVVEWPKAEECAACAHFKHSNSPSAYCPSAERLLWAWREVRREERLKKTPVLYIEWLFITTALLLNVIKMCCFCSFLMLSALYKRFQSESDVKPAAAKWLKKNTSRKYSECSVVGCWQQRTPHTHQFPGSRVVFEERVCELHGHALLVVCVFILRDTEEHSCGVGSWEGGKQNTINEKQRHFPPWFMKRRAALWEDWLQNSTLLYLWNKDWRVAAKDSVKLQQKWIKHLQVCV